MGINRIAVVVGFGLASIGTYGAAAAGGDGAGGSDAFDYWTEERVAAAVPRDLVIDHRGLGFLETGGGRLTPYGHSTPAEPLAGALARRAQASQPKAAWEPTPLAAPTIVDMDPGDLDVIGSTATFTTKIASDVGLRRVSAYVGPLSGSSFQRFSMSYAGTDQGAEVWQVGLQGFTDGYWLWYVEATDNGPQGGDTVTSDFYLFQVSASGGGGGGGSTVTNAHWTSGGGVQTASGRILFSMPDGNFVCSGTVLTDGVTGRSIVLTAAHCVYDDVDKVFASNAIFIPSQDDGGTDGTDFDCTNDPLGCWELDHGVVDVNWTTRQFPDNAAWDYAYYVAADSGAHAGTSAPDALDVAAGSLAIDFTTPQTGTTATAFGYSYDVDPDFMYCQEALGTNGTANYWLGQCGLSGGASGGSWLQPLNGGDGPIISVNSWGYVSFPGMAGPKLHDNSAQLLFDVAASSDIDSPARGFVIDPNNPPSTTTTSPATTTTTTSSPTTTTTSTTSTTSTTTSTTSTSSTTSTTTSTTVAPDVISLAVDHFKYRGEKRANLTWSGAEGTNVDVVRDGVVVATTANDGTHADHTGLRGGGSNSWQVCEAGTSRCSDVVTVVW